MHICPNLSSSTGGADMKTADAMLLYSYRIILPPVPDEQFWK